MGTPKQGAPGIHWEYERHIRTLVGMFPLCAYHILEVPFLGFQFNSFYCLGPQFLGYHARERGGVKSSKMAGIEVRFQGSGLRVHQGVPH